MKILLDGSSAVVGSRAIRRYTISLIKEFAKLKAQDEYKILLNYFRGNSKVIDLLIEGKPNFRKMHLQIPRRLITPFWTNINFPSVDLFTGKVDIFHSLGDDCPPVKSGKYIMTLHGITYMEVPELMSSNYVRNKKAWLYKMVKRADYFVSVSKYTKKEFLKLFPEIDHSRVKAIPLGVDQSFRKIDRRFVREKLFKKYNVKDPYILFVGGVEPRKNVMNIIKGFQQISESFPDLVLIVVGGADQNYLRLLKDMIIKLHLENKVIFIGPVGQEGDDLSFFYNGAECFVFPSFSEGWTSPPLEAMLCGTPVITSSVSSLPETVGNAAILVDPNSVSEIGSAIERVLSDRSLKDKFIAKGLKHASVFTWQRCAEKTYSFYKHILKSRN